jgi:hypothetical protein
LGFSNHENGAKSGLYDGYANGVPLISVSSFIASSSVCGLTLSLMRNHFFPKKIPPLVPYRISEIPLKNSGIIFPMNSLPWKHPVLQNDTFGIEERMSMSASKRIHAKFFGGREYLFFETDDFGLVSGS